MNYTLEEQEIVHFDGDKSSNDKLLYRESAARILEIDSNKPYRIKIQLVPLNTVLIVSPQSLSSIHTKPEHLLNLGFEEIDDDGVKYYKKNGINIVGIVIYPQRNHVYFTGLRVVPTIPFSFSADKYLNDKNEVLIDTLNSDFEPVDVLPHLIRFCQDKGMFNNETVDEVIKRAMAPDDE